MEDVHRFTFDCKYDAVHMRFPSVQELTDFKRKARILWCYGASLGKFDQRCKRVVECQKPIDPRLASVLTEKPFENRVGITFGLI